MRLFIPTLLATASLSGAFPWGHDHDHDDTNDNIPLQTIPNLWTLTVFAPHNPELHGQKLEWMDAAVSAGRTSSSTYCPTVVQPNCPNGTELVFAGGFWPYTMVPGGQDFYVEQKGNLYILPQHSHALPPGAYPNYIGWTWTALPIQQDKFPEHWRHQHHKQWHPDFTDDQWRQCHDRCPKDDKTFDCSYPSGYWTFQLPDSDKGGLWLCDNYWAPERGKTVWAQTKEGEFAGKDCEKILGLATHGYGGEMVWAYA